MTMSGGGGLVGPLLAGIALYHVLLLRGGPFCEAVVDKTKNSNATTDSATSGSHEGVSVATNATTSPAASTSGSSNATDMPGNASTIHPSPSTTPSVANGTLTTGEIIGIAVGVTCGGAFIIVIIICLRRNSGYRKAASAPVTYIKGGKPKHDRTPLTTKDKDPSPPPDGTDDHFYYDDEPVRRLDPSALLPTAKRPTTLRTPVPTHEEDQASLDGDAASAKDGGEDDYFFDEVYGKSAFTDETTNTAIKELSSPTDEELPDLMFKDDFDFDDDPFS